jgi:hypothetical protein
MKQVILSADGDQYLYSVPDPVAENLDRFCMEFLHWMQRTPAGKKYRDGRGFVFTEADFIVWLNENRFPEQRSRLLEDLGEWDLREKIFAEHPDVPHYNF